MRPIRIRFAASPSTAALTSEIANAGRIRLTSPLDPWANALDDFDDQIGTNLKGVYLLGRASRPGDGGARRRPHRQHLHR